MDRDRRDSKPAAVAGRPTLKSLDAVDRALLRATTVELTKLEHRVPFLATTASITPFIGLFGTVWGIMGSFQQIGATGSSSLGVVGPGIAEALIATAAGLFAAIPAVYFYNHFTNRVKHFAAEMDDFSLEFLEHLGAELPIRSGSDRGTSGTSVRIRLTIRIRGSGIAMGFDLPSSSAGSGAARTRRLRRHLARRDQRRPARRRDARAAHHLHGDRADDAAGADGEPAADCGARAR